jgi:hypothetical protein
MIHALRANSASCGRRTFPSRFVSLADANETLAAQRDHALRDLEEVEIWLEQRRQTYLAGRTRTILAALRPSPLAGANLSFDRPVEKCRNVDL